MYKFGNDWRKRNLEKCAKDQKMRRDRDPERFKDYMRKQYYGLPPGEYDKLLASQNGCCAICKTKTPGGKGGFHIDHCHNSKIVRGCYVSDVTRG